MLIDTHTHLNLGDFKKDYKEVAQRALSKNIWFINVGTDFKTSELAVKIAEEFENGVFASIGTHPTGAVRENFNKQKFLGLAKSEKVVAIGECGLDYYRTSDEKAREKQKEVFIKHIEFAVEVEKPLIIHCRDAHNDLLEILKSNRSLLLDGRVGVMHFFDGESAWENVDEYLNLGFYISFSGIITFSKYAHCEDINRLPLDRILLETDAPFAAPEPFRSQRNESAYVAEIAKKMAEILKISFEEVCEITAENAKKLFQIG